jgi:hypothetical protein
MSLPNALASAESLPCADNRTRVRMKYARLEGVFS